MIVVCSQCERKFRLDENKVPETGVKVRCSKCGFVFLVEKPSVPAGEKTDGSGPGTEQGFLTQDQAPVPDLSSTPESSPGVESPDVPPVEDDFPDVFQSGEPESQGANSDQEFDDLFSGNTGKADFQGEGDFSDLFPDGSAGESKSEEEPPPEGESTEGWQEFSLDDAGKESQPGKTPAPEAGGAEISAPAQEAAGPDEMNVRGVESPEAEESVDKKEGSGDFPEWGTIEFGEESTDEDVPPELESEPTQEEPQKAKEYQVPPEAIGQIPPGETRKVKTTRAEGIKVYPSLEEVPRLILETSFLALMIIIIFMMGGRYLVNNPDILKRMGIGNLSDNRYFREIIQQGQVATFDLESYWIENREELPVLVLEGRVFNGSAEDKDLSRFIVRLFDLDGNPILTRTVPVGVYIERDDIRNLTAAELENTMEKRVLEVPQRYPANAEFYFRIPIPGVQPQKVTYRVEVQ